MVAVATRVLGLAGAATLLVSLFLVWYEKTTPTSSGAEFTGWEAFSVLDVALVVIVAIGAGALVWTFVTESQWLPAIGLVAATLGLVLTLLAITSPPDLPNPEGAVAVAAAETGLSETSTKFAPYLALIGLVAMWLASVAAQWFAVPGAFRRCPNCTRHVRIEEPVCRFCGYRFGSTERLP